LNEGLTGAHGLVYAGEDNMCGWSNFQNDSLEIYVIFFNTLALKNIISYFVIYVLCFIKICKNKIQQPSQPA